MYSINLRNFTLRKKKMLQNWIKVSKCRKRNPRGCTLADFSIGGWGLEEEPSKKKEGSLAYWVISTVHKNVLILATVI